MSVEDSQSPPQLRPRLGLSLSLLMPGLLIAATGVGAGDLLTASYAGSHAGMSLIWAVILGALLKWVLNEGVARWQMATGTTLLEGWSARLGRGVQWSFLVYFLFWSFMVGGALIKACGVAGDGLFPLGSDRATSQILWGVIHSLVGLTLVWLGGFRLFEKVMTACIALMFVSVVFSAILLGPDWQAVGRGLRLADLDLADLPWALGLLGGVGGTVTLLSYGYWVRESGRSGELGAWQSRIDLASAYTATAIFGLAMLVISSRIQVDTKGAEVALMLADQLKTALGPAGSWLFLLGFWGAVFSSLLGVWQSAPYLFADFLQIVRRTPDEARTVDFAKTSAYRVYLVGIALVPLLLLGISVKQVQLYYAVLGALFMPFLALTLLILNNKRDWVGERFRNGPVINALLVLTLLLFAVLGVLETLGKAPRLGG